MTSAFSLKLQRDNVLMDAEQALNLQEGRFSRLEAIEWWNQERLAHAKIFVAGAGALGNEVIKNLALLGVGNVIITDMDEIELSNLSRSVLYRAEDEGRAKAKCAAEAAVDIYPDIKVKGIVGNLLSDIGLGYFRWADVVIGALDNREARVFINSSCAQVGTPWIDGGIEVLHGIVRAFHAPEAACYECTMSQVDWDLLNKRRSCSLLARRAIQQRGTPTTPTTASVIGGIQVQEAIKLLHDRTDFLGKGFFFDGAMHDSYPINYSINHECMWHEDLVPAKGFSHLTSSSLLGDVWECAHKELGALTELELSREIVHTLDCPNCQDRKEVLRPLTRVASDDAWCDACSTERIPSLLHAIRSDSELMDRSLASIGIPYRDIFWARNKHEYLGIEISGDTLFGRSPDEVGENG